jgi:hypothetical protein
MSRTNPNQPKSAVIFNGELPQVDISRGITKDLKRLQNKFRATGGAWRQPRKKIA